MNTHRRTDHGYLNDFLIDPICISVNEYLKFYCFLLKTMGKRAKTRSTLK